MKRMKKILTFVCAALLLFCVFGCGDQRVFEIKNGTMSDATVTYVRLPNNWYHMGSYTNRIGKVKGGNALYGSDEDGTFVQERKPLLADMEYAPWVRSDYQFPALYEDMEINILLYGEKESVILSEQAKAEFIEWARKYDAGEINSVDKNNKQPFASVCYLFPIAPDLTYDPDFWLIEDDAAISVKDLTGTIIGSFDSETAFYKETTQN